jgi:serine/threonine protein kinase
VKRSITAIEKEYIGKGSFGKIYGNDSFVSKTMKTEDSESLYLLNNELKLMIAYNTEYDFTNLHENSCWYQYNYRQYHYEVKAKMDRMQSDMKAALRTSSLKSRTIWKIDMMFKILVGMKKMHDANILHLDLKEANIMMMNQYTPVIADFGMSLLDGERRNWVGGTPLFMSPEINRGVYGKGGDVFALGIIFFQLLNERFVNNQTFRKLCNRSEFVYSNIYCLFDETINKMMSTSSY